jgi:hypothetical protein
MLLMNMRDGTHRRRSRAIQVGSTLVDKNVDQGGAKRQASVSIRRRPFPAVQVFSGALGLPRRPERAAVEQAKDVGGRMKEKSAFFTRDDPCGEFAALNDIGLGHDRLSNSMIGACAWLRGLVGRDSTSTSK